MFLRRCRRVAITFVSCTIAGHVIGQLPIEATLTAGTDLVCTAQADFQVPFERREPAGAILSHGLDLTASQFGAGSVTATAAFRLRTDPREVVASITESVSGVGFYGRATCGSHDTILHLRAPRTITARLTISASSDVRQTGVVYSAAVDVGDDGSFELTASRDRTRAIDLPVQIGPGGLAVRARTATLAGAVHDPFVATGSLTIKITALDDLDFTFTTDTPVALGIPPNTYTVPRGWNLWPLAGENLDLRTRGTSFRTRVELLRDGLRVLLDEDGYAAGTSAALADHELLLTLRAPVSRTLRAEVAIDDRRDGYGVTYHAAIDVGDDGVFDLAAIPGQRVARTIAIVVGQSGFRIRTRSGGAISSTLGYRPTFQATIDIKISPAPDCTVTPYGVPCVATAPTLVGRVGLQNALELDLDSRHPNTLGKLIFGVVAVDRPLPFSMCRLYTDPVVSLPFATDAAGRASQTLPVPASIALDFFAEHLLLVSGAPLELSATNGVAVRCR